jgi:hypothetical protein
MQPLFVSFSSKYLIELHEVYLATPYGLDGPGIESW